MSLACPFESVAIIGVGLIGGSLAAALRDRFPDVRRIGIGRSQDRLNEIRDAGLIDEGSTDRDILAEADLVVACTPVDRIVADLLAAALHCRAGTILTDAGSVKGAIEAGVAGLPGHVTYIGSHPLAGSEKSGWEYAESDLFVDRLCVIATDAADDSPDLTRVERFWQSVGMRTLRLTAAEHDRLIASTSHLPHVVAAALASLVPAEAAPLAATGFRDTTRVAGGDAQLWRAILEANRQSVVDQLDRVIASLGTYRDALASGDMQAVTAMLASARENRRAVLDSSSLDDE